jgi:uncharacterized protein YpbB
MYTELSPIAQKTAQYINFTTRNLFLTGKAGTGKTTFLKYLLQNCSKKMAIVAPTGIAAINAGGVTIHSFFQLPFGCFLPQKPEEISKINFNFTYPEKLISQAKIHDRKRAILKELELLIIDEVSMLRADVLDAINVMLKHVRRNHQAFGGVQLLLIGDLLQLPPVVKKDEWEYLSKHYKSVYFFDSVALAEKPCIYLELDKIYRQSDLQFINVLNNLRNNIITPDDIKLLNRYYKPIETFGDKKFITLTTHNYKADKINSDKLGILKTPQRIFKAQISGDFPEYLYPSDPDLTFKIGSQVMFIKNDISGQQQYFNGKIGEVLSFEDGIVVKTDDYPEGIKVDKYTWENNKYNLNSNTNEIEEECIGTYTQYPLKLAWAITVHKSQGLTFENAVLDISDAFAPGQVYVALSRLKSLEGLILTQPIRNNQLMSDEKINNYTSEASAKLESPEQLRHDTLNYIVELMQKAFNLNWLNKNIEEHLSTYTQNEKQSNKQKHYDFALSLFVQIKEMKKHSDVFYNQAIKIINEREHQFENKLATRVNEARIYFEGKYKSISTDIITLLENVQEEERINTFIEELLYIENIVFEQRKLLKRVSDLCCSFAGNEKEVYNLYSGNRIDKRKNLENALQQKKKIKKEKSVRKVTKEGSIQNQTVGKEKKPSTRETTLKLSKQGLSIEEIAKEQKLTTGTIEGHIAQLTAMGTLSAFDFISRKKINLILDKAKEINSFQLKSLKETLGNEYSYFEIKLAIASLRES